MAQSTCSASTLPAHRVACRVRLNGRSCRCFGTGLLPTEHMLQPRKAQKQSAIAQIEIACIRHFAGSSRRFVDHSPENDLLTPIARFFEDHLLYSSYNSAPIIQHTTVITRRWKNDASVFPSFAPLCQRTRWPLKISWTAVRSATFSRLVALSSHSLESLYSHGCLHLHLLRVRSLR